MTSDSKLGGGAAENTFFSVTLYNFRKSGKPDMCCFCFKHFGLHRSDRSLTEAETETKEKRNLSFLLVLFPLVLRFPFPGLKRSGTLISFPFQINITPKFGLNIF